MADFECGFEESFPQEGEPLEERSLNLLKDSEIDQAFAEAKAKRKGGKKHKVKWMRRPMVMPEAILEFLDEDLRENAIRYLSNFLIEKREEDPINYNRAGFLLFFSCGTMPTLLQELVGFYRKMSEEALNVRAIKRLANVLTLFQCVAANNGARQKFVDACIPNYLIPLIEFECPIELFDNIRAIALSVIGILCQAGEPFVIDWAIKSNVVEVCHTILATASELNKVIAMHILEAIIRDNSGISYICDSSCNLLIGLMNTWDNLVNLLAVDQDFSPRLLFHIIRCYIMLCSNERGCAPVVQRFPAALTNGSFCDMIELLLYVDKVNEEILPGRRVCMLLQEYASMNDLCSPDSAPNPTTPCRPMDLGTISV
ncbi:cell differentiation protein RCD1 homolog isoform X2 [Phalaenopsis equestris]|uniref:cell differentiation protein RCD1 homolog isoform X2 n=1 Tax=Phalaenopsis equestris TaxID=78828 RepID=UPI0009E249BA|nr:cell differentiation protein RCD1 homolog isoform X2 [Phalaenopsis equestris]